MLQQVELYKIIPDGSVWGYWRGFRLPISTACTTVWTPAGTPMHWRHNTWEAKSHEITFFWPDRWYVIHAFYQRNKRFFGCYCDIVMPNQPIALDATEMRYIDLYVDVVVKPDHDVYTKDEEVYERAMKSYPDLLALHDQAFAELDALARHARDWTGPFAVLADEIIRTDWNELDAHSAEFAASRDAQWGNMLQ